VFFLPEIKFLGHGSE